MDPLHVAIALGPLAMYLLVLGLVNLSSRPLVTTGARDVASLGIAISGFVVAGPMELFLPEAAAVFWGGRVWLLMIGCYALMVVFVMLIMRPRLVIYNIDAAQLAPVLTEVSARLDPDARWAGDSLVMPQLGVQLHVESLAMLKNVQLVSAGPRQDTSGWRRLENELATALRLVRGAPNPYGISLLSFGVAMAGVISYWLARDPAGVEQALNQMLRR